MPTGGGELACVAMAMFVLSVAIISWGISGSQKAKLEEYNEKYPKRGK